MQMKKPKLKTCTNSNYQIPISKQPGGVNILNSFNRIYSLKYQRPIYIILPR